MNKTNKILIIDDTFYNFYLLKKILKLYQGSKILWGKNGEEGLELYEKEKPDIILLDLFMPVVNGFQVLDSIREHDKTTPIIVLSAFTCAENKMEALSHGCNDFVGKPIEPKYFIYLMKRYIELERIVTETHS